MSAQRPSIADKRREFHRLHLSGCFVIPNPWDPGTARYLQSLGFKALATTSSGFAWSRGRPDYGISREASLSHLAELVEASDLPINADFQNGFGHDPRGVAESVELAVDTGVAGLSIEASSRIEAFVRATWYVWLMAKRQRPEMAGFSSTAFLLADPARAVILTALLDGRTLPASELAYAARITAFSPRDADRRGNASIGRNDSITLQARWASS